QDDPDILRFGGARTYRQAATIVSEMIEKCRDPLGVGTGHGAIRLSEGGSAGEPSSVPVHHPSQGACQVTRFATIRRIGWILAISATVWTAPLMGQRSGPVCNN